MLKIKRTHFHVVGGAWSRFVFHVHRSRTSHWWWSHPTGLRAKAHAPETLCPHLYRTTNTGVCWRRRPRISAHSMLFFVHNRATYIFKPLYSQCRIHTYIYINIYFKKWLINLERSTVRKIFKNCFQQELPMHTHSVRTLSWKLEVVKFKSWSLRGGGEGGGGGCLPPPYLWFISEYDLQIFYHRWKTTSTR